MFPGDRFVGHAKKFLVSKMTVNKGGRDPEKFSKEFELKGV